MWETWVRSLGWEDTLEKGKATHSSFWPKEFHGLCSPWGRKESDMTEQLLLSHARQAHFDWVLLGSGGMSMTGHLSESSLWGGQTRVRIQM